MFAILFVVGELLIWAVAEINIFRAALTLQHIRNRVMHAPLPRKVDELREIVVA